MPSEWTTIRLGDVCPKIGSGATPRGGGSVYLERGEVALIRSQNVYNDGFHREGIAYLTEDHARELANVEVEPNDVLLNITGDSVARCCQVDPGVLPARVNQHVAIIRPDPEQLDPRFLRYFLISPVIQTQLLSWAGAGGTRNALTKGMIESLEVFAPRSAGQQRAIAHVLGSLDDKIELSRRMNRTLEALARAVFRAWFVDFEPVKAKAAGATRFPGMPQPLIDQLPTTLVESDLGPIPEGWEVGSLGDYCTINARAVRKADLVGMIEYVDISAVTVGHLDSVMLVDAADAPSRARRIVRHADTIWSCVRPNRRSYYFVHSPPANRIVSTGFAVLSPGEFCPAFLYELVTRPEFVDHLVAHADGSAYPAVRADHFAIARVIAPPKQVREAFDDLAMPIRDLVAQADRESRTLAAIRDALLPKLISGEVRVNASRAAVEEVA